MPECNFEKFAEFVLKKEKYKKSFVKREMSNNEEYGVEKDFYLKLRTRLKKILKYNLSLDELDSLIEEVSSKKIPCYEKAIQCIKEFLQDKDYIWESHSKSEIKYGDLIIKVNPQLALRINNELYIIRIHFKKKEISRPKVNILLKIMQSAYQNDTNAVKLAVWDICQQNLYTLGIEEEIKISQNLEQEAAKWIKYEKDIDE